MIALVFVPWAGLGVLLYAFNRVWRNQIQAARKVQDLERENACLRRALDDATQTIVLETQEVIITVPPAVDVIQRSATARN